MDKEKIKRLAAKLLDGSASREEEEILHRWYDSKAAQQDDRIPVHSVTSRAELKRRIRSGIRTMPHSSNESGRQTRKKGLQIAAAITILVVSGLAWYFISNTRAAEWIMVEVPLGESRKVILPDSSTAWVNAGSSIRYPDHFDTQARSVELVNGQAFFEVRKDSLHPFFVHTGHVDVRVLGTSFDIKSYAEEEATSVEVRSGRVNVRIPGTGKSENLDPGKMAVIGKASPDIEVTDKASDYIGAWMDGRIVFYNEPMAMVINALERNYNVRIEADDKTFLQSPLTIKLDHQPLGDILEALQYIFDFQYTIDDHEKNITITKN